MKKKLCLIIISLLALGVLSACQDEKKQTIPEGFYPYEKSEVKSVVQELSFQPELPGFIPMKVEILVSDKYVVEDSNMEALDISFYTRNNDLLSIQFYDGIRKQQTVDPEKVNISENIEGKYMDNSFAKTLTWIKSGITYQMTFRPSSTNTNQQAASVTKSDLIKVAQSF
ncbi:hypothetical protein [Aquibacillus kalidii]|uniref:hypothetical protein n=1 Tax=Aquibacillus kalidii TaxID=2762597 RepID=UPI001645115D|nr:hypothetical protein [Aquibacillus kalidii]